MSGLERYLEEHGIGVAFGVIAGVAIVVALIVVIAMSDRRPPDDDP